MKENRRLKGLQPRFENKLESQGFRWIIGVDEAGRGPLAGPVVAGAVALKAKTFRFPIRDSKAIPPEDRVEAYHEIHQKAFVGVGIMSESVIDEHNILNATFMAMAHAVEDVIAKLPSEEIEDPQFPSRAMLLIDGNRFRSRLPYSYKTIVDGDAQVLSIACASIIAKVTRDRILNIYDQIFPQYGFKKHKGYCTVEHRKAIEQHGPVFIHRRSFSLTAQVIEDDESYA